MHTLDLGAVALAARKRASASALPSLCPVLDLPALLTLGSLAPTTAPLAFAASPPSSPSFFALSVHSVSPSAAPARTTGHGVFSGAFGIGCVLRQRAVDGGQAVVVGVVICVCDASVDGVLLKELECVVGFSRITVVWRVFHRLGSVWSAGCCLIVLNLMRIMYIHSFLDNEQAYLLSEK